MTQRIMTGVPEPVQKKLMNGNSYFRSTEKYFGTAIAD